MRDLTSEPIRVDSVAEEYAYLAAYPPPIGQWRIVSQTLGPAQAGMEDLVLMRSDLGEDRAIRFAVASFFGTIGITRNEVPTTEYLDALMEKAATAAAETGAHHPGSLPRFPMPSDRYPGRLDIPMPILAVDNGRRGLYAPARVVTIGYEDMEAFGVGEFPGFDPDDWPPPRVGDWPPSRTAGFDRGRLQGTISRFNALSVRLFDAFFSGKSYPHESGERSEFTELLKLLDPPDMEPYYRRLSSRFFERLDMGRS